MYTGKITREVLGSVGTVHDPGQIFVQSQIFFATRGVF